MNRRKPAKKQQTCAKIHKIGTVPSSLCLCGNSLSGQLLDSGQNDILVSNALNVLIGLRRGQNVYATVAQQTRTCGDQLTDNNVLLQTAQRIDLTADSHEFWSSTSHLLVHIRLVGQLVLSRSVCWEQAVDSLEDVP